MRAGIFLTSVFFTLASSVVQAATFQVDAFGLVTSVLRGGVADAGAPFADGQTFSVSFLVSDDVAFDATGIGTIYAQPVSNVMGSIGGATFVSNPGPLTPSQVVSDFIRITDDPGVDATDLVTNVVLDTAVNGETVSQFRLGIFSEIPLVTNLFDDENLTADKFSQTAANDALNPSLRLRLFSTDDQIGDLIVDARLTKVSTTPVPAVPLPASGFFLLVALAGAFAIQRKTV